MKLGRRFFFFPFFFGIGFQIEKNGRENEKSSKEQHLFFNGEEKEGRRSQMTGCAVCVFGGGEDVGSGTGENSRTGSIREASEPRLMESLAAPAACS